MIRTEAVSVPLVDLISQHAPLRPELLQAVGRVLDHGQFVLGPEVTELEQVWATACGVKHAVSVSDGTTALFLVLKALGLRFGDEVITAPNSFVSSASCVVHAGGTPTFADVGEDFNLDPAAVCRAITSRTKGIIAVHLTGRPADMTAINALAAEQGLFVLEDAAQAFGARHAGRAVGSLGLAGCFSLHPLKAAGACGDAGMITTNDDALADRLIRLRNHGMLMHHGDCTQWGHNARMDTMQAALVLVKLAYVDDWTRRRRNFASIYRERLHGAVRIPCDRPDDHAIYQSFPVEVDHRDELMEHLRSRGIGTGVQYPVPIHLLEAARELGRHPGDFPTAERLARRCLNLPIHPSLSEEQVQYVCDVVLGFSP